MNKKKFGAVALLLLLLCLCFSTMTVSAAGKSGFRKNGADTYYYKNGALYRGWLTKNNKKYFFLKADGKMAIGRYKINNTTYYFDKDGVFIRTLPGANWVVTASGRRYDNGNGNYSKAVWQTIQGKRYRFNKAGYVFTGWNRVGSAWYFFDKKGVLQSNKWIRTNGASYYVGADGKRVVDSWVGNYYVGSDGKRIPGYVDETRNNASKTGWVGYGRSWKYYVNGSLVTGWRTINSQRYYFESTGFLKSGWLYDGEDYYFLSTNLSHIGIMCTGWQLIDGKNYYFFEKKVVTADKTYKMGTMARNIRVQYKGKIYNFNAKGVCTNFDSE